MVHLMIRVNDNGMLVADKVKSPPVWKEQTSKLYYAETTHPSNGKDRIIYWSYSLTHLVGIVGTTSNEVHNIGSLG